MKSHKLSNVDYCWGADECAGTDNDEENQKYGSQH